MRAGDWWEHKFVPILTLFYATAFLLDRPIAETWQGLAILLLCLIPGAAYVSLINDATDRELDAAAGKPNRLAGRPPIFVALALMLTIAGGLVFIWLWRGDRLLVGTYLAAWIAFSLYSLPPFRLKTRGIAGLAADSAGALLFPGLVAAILAFRWSGASPDYWWLASIGAWAFAYGLRGIVWHQLVDCESDRIAGVNTFVQLYSARSAAAIARHLIFPVEIAALGLVLWQLQSAAPAIALLLYALLMKRRVRVFVVRLVIVEPRERYVLLLQEYYDFFLPLAILLGSALHHPIDLLLVAGHILLFPRRVMQVARDAWTLRGF